MTTSCCEQPTLQQTTQRSTFQNGATSRLTWISKEVRNTANTATARTYRVRGNGPLNGFSDSDLVLRSHRQRVVRVRLQVFNANATVCRHVNTRQNINRLFEKISRTNSKTDATGLWINRAHGSQGLDFGSSVDSVSALKTDDSDHTCQKNSVRKTPADILEDSATHESELWSSFNIHLFIHHKW